MNGRDRPTCWIIAGPNGAGKTTFALEYLPEADCQNFVNADLIVAGMSPLAPEREHREVIQPGMMRLLQSWRRS